MSRPQGVSITQPLENSKLPVGPQLVLAFTLLLPLPRTAGP